MMLVCWSSPGSNYSELKGSSGPNIKKKEFLNFLGGLPINNPSPFFSSRHILFGASFFMYQTRLLSSKWLHLSSSRSAAHVRYMQQLTSPELRSTFIKYFEKQGHTPVKSASLVPHNDKSLLFTNAGKYP